jgi:cysteine synthase A
VESFDPLSSIKDRIGAAMIETAERNGLLNNNSVIIEPTSGNTGIALAFICATRGYRFILTMPETMSVGRSHLLFIFGAELVLTEEAKGMKGAVNKAGPHKIQGIGAGFVPEILNRSVIDEIMIITNEDAGNTACHLAKEEGILAGISSGANL